MPRYDVTFKIRGTVTIDGVKASSPEDAVKDALEIAKDGDASLDYEVKEDTGDATEVDGKNTTEEATQTGSGDASSSEEELTSSEQRRAARRKAKREKRRIPA